MSTASSSSSSSSPPPPPPNLASPIECRQCFNKDDAQFEEDLRTADLICMRCGFVANRLVSEETEWRDFEEDEVSKSRVGAANSIYGESKLETHVAGYNKGGDRLAARGGIARKHQQLSHDDPGDSAYRQRIAQMGDICELDESVKAQAESMYVKVSTALKDIDGKKARMKRDGLCAAIIFLACKKAGAPRTFKELHRITLIPERDITSAYKHIVKNLPMLVDRSGMTAVESLLRRMCGELRVPPVTEELAVTVANNLRSDNEGRLPSTVAACALTMVMMYAPPRDVPRPSDQAICECAGIAQSTVHQVLRDMLPSRDVLFPAGFKFPAGVATAAAALTAPIAAATAVAAVNDNNAQK